MGGLGLEYNLPRQTTNITPPGGGTSPTSGAQAYDGVEQDRRTAAGDTVMSYGYAGQVTAQNTGGSTPTGQIFVRDPAGDLIAMLSRDPSNPGTITDVDYYLLDDQKTVMATHDGRGNLTGDGLIRYLYEPYGQLIRTWTQNNAGTPTPGGDNPGDDSQDSDASAPNTDNNPFTYVSGYHDRATGPIKYGTRYYIPTLGRWTQHDPEQGEFSDPLTLGRFQYVEFNPTNNTDPTGRYSEEDGAFIGTTILAVAGFAFTLPFSGTAAALVGGTYLIAGLITSAGITYG